jgi:hypothetical protein
MRRIVFGLAVLVCVGSVDFLAAPASAACKICREIWFNPDVCDPAPAGQTGYGFCNTGNDGVCRLQDWGCIGGGFDDPENIVRTKGCAEVATLGVCDAQLAGLLPFLGLPKVSAVSEVEFVAVFVNSKPTRGEWIRADQGGVRCSRLEQQPRFERTPWS